MFLATASLMPTAARATLSKCTTDCLNARHPRRRRRDRGRQAVVPGRRPGRGRGQPV